MESGFILKQLSFVFASFECLVDAWEKGTQPEQHHSASLEAPFVSPNALPSTQQPSSAEPIFFF